MMKISRVLLVLGVAALILAAAYVTWPRVPGGLAFPLAPSPLPAASEGLEQVTIGIMGNIADASLFVAADKGFFQVNGLDVTFKNYPTGLAATNDMMGGKVDVAYTTEFVDAEKAFQKANLSIVTIESKSLGAFIVGRKDRGIRNASDLLEKKIGLARGTITEFQLGRFLDLHGMSVGDVTIVGSRPEGLIGLLDNGTVDAIVVGTRYVDNIRKQRGDAMVYWPAESGQPGFDTLVSEKGLLTRHPEEVRRVLSSLVMAQDYMASDPEGAQEIVRNRLGWDEEYTANLWSQVQFELSLDQSLITAMEDEARWMIRNNLTTQKTIPDFRNYVYKDGLEAVRPGSVNIIS
jgi:NitT/TauT family transport system substrate-binding protein